MSAVIDPWLDIIRREAQHVAFHGQTKSTLICTSYNPETHAIKGILVPHNVETGWVSLAAIHAGNGFGILVGPKVGSADKLDGDQFDVHFEHGDPNAPMAVHRRFSVPDKPPRVESGEMLLQQEGSNSSSGKNNNLFFDKDKNVTLAHESGNSLKFGADKTITTTHFAKNGTMTWDTQGNVAVKTNGGNVTTDAGSGSHSITAQNHVIKGNIAIEGDINQTGSHTVSGQVAAAGVTSGGQPVQTA